MRKTQNADRDASILADYERGIRASDLKDHYCLSRRGIFAAIRRAQKARHMAPHQATMNNLRMSEGEWKKGGKAE